MKNIKILLIVIPVLLLSSCNYFTVQESKVNPNSPSVASVITNASKEQIDFLATGVFSAMRTSTPGTGLGDYYRLTGIFGRETYVLATNDSRWYTETLNGNIDNTNFLNAYYLQFSASRERAQVLLESVDGTSSISATEKEAAKGFANTVKALAMLHLLNLQGTNGIRIDLDGDPLKPGPAVTYDLALTEIQRLLDLGSTQLGSGGTAFSFVGIIPAGFAAFNTPATFRQFNRALAARVAVYRRDWAGALTALTASFYNPAGTFTAGPVYNFNATAPDFANPLFQAANSTAATISTLHPSFRADIRVGDTRISKIAARTTARAAGGLSSADEPTLYLTNTTTIPIINNEELILINAEANIQLGNTGAATASLDRIRNAYGLGNYAGAIDQASLINEMLYQRRYSLFFLGHRWVDLRRYNRLTDLPVDIAGHVRLDKMPRPFAEVAWDQSR